MSAPSRWCLLLGVALVYQGCSSAKNENRTDRVQPASDALADLLPAAAANASFREAPGSTFALRAGAGTPGSSLLARYELGSTEKEGSTAAGVWSFGVDGDGLRAVLGESAVSAARVNLATALRPLLSRAEVRSAVASALATSPAFRTVNANGAWDVDALTIEGVALADGLDVDEDGDGVFETPRSVLTLMLRLPPIDIGKPAAPYAACNAVLGDGSVPAAKATQAGVTYVPAAAASWRYQLTLVVNVTLESLAPAHAALWTPTSYVSRGERDAAAYDLAVFRDFLASPANHLAGVDVAIAFTPSSDLVQGTLSVVSSVAREAGDAACTRDVDAWLLEPTVLLPRLSAAQLSGAIAPVSLVYSYDAGVDALDGISDPGLGCLHDSGGKVVEVGPSDLACSTASGAVVMALSSSALGTRVAVATPYGDRGRGAKYLAAACGDATWKDYCSGTFGRGINMCIGEWALRGQVGDYWRIKFFKSPWKAALQKLIKGYGYLARMGISRMFPHPILQEIEVDAVANGVPHALDRIRWALDMKVFKWKLVGAADRGVPVFERWLTNPPWWDAAAEQVEQDFSVGRFADGIVQMLQIQGTGWQDVTDDSCGRCGFNGC